MWHRYVPCTRFASHRPLLIQNHPNLLGFRSKASANPTECYKDYYKILQIKPSASQTEIRDAYLKLTKKFHPDAAGKEQTARFVEATEAYSVLSKTESRQEYDANMKLLNLGLARDGFRMTYPKPSSDIDPVALEAFNEEMRRRWFDRLDQWARSQAKYELERGVMMETVSHILPPLARVDLMERQTRMLLQLTAGVSFVVFMAFSLIVYFNGTDDKVVSSL